MPALTAANCKSSPSMPFFLTVITPFIFLFGAYRLVQLALKLRQGVLQLNFQRGWILPLSTVLALFILVSCTAGVFAGYLYLLWGLFLPNFPMAQLLPLGGLILAYPPIFFGCEWVFYYGLKPPKAIAS